MAVKVDRRDLRSKQIITAQDHPIPIETHGLNDIRINTLANSIKMAIGRVNRPEVEKPLSDLLDAILIVRENKTQFDSIRENIEILWKRTKRALDELDNYSGALPNGDENITDIPDVPVDPPVVVTIQDVLFFAYDAIGQIQFTMLEKPLTLDTEVIKDSEYAHTSDAADVELSDEADYEIEADASFDLNEGDIIELKLQVDTGSGFNDVPGSLAYCTA